MPLHEFLKMFRGKLESSQDKAPSPTQISSGPENELVELLWENGLIMMQGQSSRAKKSPMLNDFQSQPSVVQDRFAGNATNRKIENFGALGSSFGVASASVPLAMGDMYLIQEDEMAPWLSYPEEDGFKQVFCSEISPDISGVTSNEPSSHNSFLSLVRGSSNQMLQHPHMVQVINGANLEAPNAAKVSPRPGFLNSYLSVQGQISVPSVGSGVSNINTNTTDTRPDAVFGNSVEVQASADDFNSMKIQKPNAVLPGSGSNFLNFSHFSRPVALLRANLEKADGFTASCSSGVEKMGNEKVSTANSNTPVQSTHTEPCSSPRKEICCHSQPKSFSSKGNLKPSVVKPLEESYCTEQSDALHQEGLIKSPRQAIGASICREVTKREKPVEHVVAAASVCSGNSGASNDQIHNSKRKIRDNDESESQSEDIEEEFVGVKKPPHARGCSSSKRSRAAAVHNLSERRRRDRINEKMRALQELIPNCHKADKASMLDEAIEYLKTLQLQVQMMSMGAGLCMPPMMFPTGLQHMHPALMPHFPPLAGGMGMGMGFGMGMLGLNSGSPRFPVYPLPPMPGAHFPYPPISVSSALQGLAEANHPIFGHPGQGLPTSVPRAPLVPLMKQAPITSAVGLNTISMGIPVESASTSPTFKPDLPLQNEDSRLIRNANSGNTMDQPPDQQQTTIKDFDQSVLESKDNQVLNVSTADSAVNLSTSDDVSRKGGD